MPGYEAYKKLFAHLPMPFAYLDLSMLDRNIADIAAAAGNKNIRIASKSIRSVDVLRRILDSGAPYGGVMCYTASEAAFLADQGFDDLLLGYPTWEADGIRALVERVAAGKQITFMVDSIEHVAHIEKFAQGSGTRVPLCLDVDMSTSYPGLRFGVWRSPINGWEQAKPVVEAIVGSRWLKLDGIMGYEAQIAGVGDDVPGATFQNRIVCFLQKRSVSEVARRRAEVVRGLSSIGVALRFVNAGGTGSLATSREEEFVTEVTAGSGFYGPTLFDYYKSFRYLPAAGFAVEIVRKPRVDIVTCLGGGYVASGAAGATKLPQPYLPQNLRLFSLEGAGEVQTPVLANRPEHRGLHIGDPIFFRHAKAGELCERFDCLNVVADGAIVGKYATYRGMGGTSYDQQGMPVEQLVGHRESKA
ncbi:amino acid deaminase/aldolase [Cohnella soli]|uniref:Amino acid deaminase/aldolase n=1 Tax=Cohnella soli TaxID=425005 RepID=A0ABW0I3B1_9BACL